LLLSAASAAALVALSGCAAAGTTADAPISLAPPHAPIVEGRAVPVVPHPDQLSLLESDDPQLAANKRVVFDLWRSVLNAGHVEVADQLLTEDYIQHNPTARTGRTAFKEIFSSFVPRQETIPELIQNPLVTIVAEGDYAVMAFVDARDAQDGSGPYTSTHFDMFRLENGRVAEHWDSVQLQPGQNPPSAADGGPVPVAGVSGDAQIAMVYNEDPVLRANKRTVYDLWRQIPDAGREELTDLYLDPIYIQHNPNAATGSEGFRTYMANRPDTPIETHYRHQLVAMVAEGDIVVQVLADTRPHPDRPDETYTIAWFDMFRIEGGRLAEHWDAAARGELRRD
jgi:predicted SnoaL-like aldol condensation-catalyzing enzyme